MSLTKSEAAQIVQEYIGLSEPPPVHGWGISGFIFQSPDKKTAIKVYRHAEGFSTELAVYQKFQRIGLTNLHGLTIPKMRHYRWDLRVIRMDFVFAPYLLDFAGVSFNPPDFSPDVMSDWYQQIELLYGPNASIAYAVYHSLAKHGIYYVDFRPSNMNLRGLPDAVPFDSSGED